MSGEMRTLPDLAGEEGIFSDGDWIESKDQDPEGEVRLIQLSDVGDGRFRNRSNRFLTTKKADELGCTYLKSGDILIARMPDPLGRACLFPDIGRPAVTAVDVCILRTGDGVDAKWAMHTINAPQFRSRVHAMQSGTTRKRISRKNLSTIEVPIPSFERQVATRDEIEKQFTRLDFAQGSLGLVAKNLGRYWDSALQSAVTGRAVPCSQGQSGEDLLRDVLRMRRLEWEAATSAKYKEPAEPEIAGLPEVPSNWTIASLESITSAVRVICYGILMPGPEIEDGIRVVKVKNIRNGKVVVDNLARTSADIAAKYQRASLAAGDLLLTIRGTYGRVAPVPPELEGANITQDTVRLDISSSVNASYIELYLRSPIAQNFMKRHSRGVAVRGVNVGDVRQLPVLLPPLEEQDRIADAMERFLSVGNALETQVKEDLSRLERLRASILSRAFSGELLGSVLTSHGLERQKSKTSA